MFLIDDDTAYQDFKEYLEENPTVLEISSQIIKTKDYTVKVSPQYSDLLKLAEKLKEEPKKSSNFSAVTATGVVENQGYKFLTF